MNRAIVAAAVGMALLSIAPAHAKEDGKKQRGILHAQRAGWMLGMYVGEEKGQPFPFVLQVDPKSDARLKGVKSGDEIIRLEEEETTSVRTLFDRIRALRPGRLVSLWVRRGVATMQFRLVVPKNPTGAPQSAEASDKKDEKSAEQGAEGEKKAKKKKRKPPIVFKPIPADNQ